MVVVVVVVAAILAGMITHRERETVIESVSLLVATLALGHYIGFRIMFDSLLCFCFNLVQLFIGKKKLVQFSNVLCLFVYGLCLVILEI